MVAGRRAGQGCARRRGGRAASACALATWASISPWRARDTSTRVPNSQAPWVTVVLGGAEVVAAKVRPKYASGRPKAAAAGRDGRTNSSADIAAHSHVSTTGAARIELGPPRGSVSVSSWAGTCTRPFQMSLTSKELIQSRAARPLTEIA